MTSYFYPEDELRLSEGKYYPFLVYNLVKLQDSHYYFVLEDPFKLRHFIPEEPYYKYGFNIGDLIKCHVDRINCTGRVFLEPLHPFYKSGQFYNFDIELIEYLENGETRMEISDCLGNKIVLHYPEITKVDPVMRSIKCKVQQIKKGIPELEIITMLEVNL